MMPAAVGTPPAYRALRRPVAPRVGGLGAAVDRRYREWARYLCRQLELAAAIGPRTERAFLEETRAIDLARTLARERMGEAVVVLRNGAELRRREATGGWVHTLDGAETPL